MLLPSRRASIGSTCNSGEDIATTPASSEVDEKPNEGVLASSLLTQERQVQLHSGFITQNRENSESRSSHVPTSTERPVAMYSHKRMSSRDSHFVQGLQRERERIQTEHRELCDFSELRVDHAVQGEKAALSKTL